MVEVKTSLTSRNFKTAYFQLEGISKGTKFRRNLEEWLIPFAIKLLQECLFSTHENTVVWNIIPQLDIQSKRRAVVLLKISAAVRRSFGSCRSIFLTKSFAPLDIEGQGSEVKSMWPRKTASNMPSSFSGENKRLSEGNNQLHKSDKRKKKRLKWDVWKTLPAQKGGTPDRRM